MTTSNNHMIRRLETFWKIIYHIEQYNTVYIIILFINKYWGFVIGVLLIPKKNLLAFDNNIILSYTGWTIKSPFSWINPDFLIELNDSIKIKIIYLINILINFSLFDFLKPNWITLTYFYSISFKKYLSSETHRNL